MSKFRHKNISGYSLLEMLITLVVFAILMTMIVQVLLLSIDSGRKIAGRSKVRGDLTEVGVMIRRDIRNASKIDSLLCGDTVNHNNLGDGLIVADGNACFFSLAGNSYAWVTGTTNTICPENSMCKMKFDTTENNYKIYYVSSDVLKFDQTSTRFELKIYQDDDTSTQGIILATLSADIREDLNIDVPKQFRQISVFTRNF